MQKSKDEGGPKACYKAEMKPEPKKDDQANPVVSNPLNDLASAFEALDQGQLGQHSQLGPLGGLLGALLGPTLASALSQQTSEASEKKENVDRPKTQEMPKEKRSNQDKERENPGSEDVPPPPMGANPLNDLAAVFGPVNQDQVQMLGGLVNALLGPAAASAVFSSP